MTSQPEIKLFNTMSREVETLKPISPGSISLYTCGLTVYCPPHIGNWVAYTYWDLLQRVLTNAGYQVNRIENYTDVGHLVSDSDQGEDKMEKGARLDGTDAWAVADKYIKIAENERKRLGFLEQTTFIRATDRIDRQIEMVEALQAAEVTYELDDGIYFDSSQFSDYAKLGHLDLEGLDTGHRVEDHGKRNASDFAVWKFSPSGAKRDMQWEYPAGSGRMGFPGWHLECSAIIKDTLGDTIDIHTGGIDHIPVHHSNEIAQSHTANNAALANIWLHNNHMKIAGDKLAKSAGNSYTIDDIESRGFTSDAFKLLVYSSHYRTEGNFSWEILEASQNRLNHWRSALTGTVFGASDGQASDASGAVEQAIAHLRNDLDTPKALSVIDQAVAEIDKGLTAMFDVSHSANNIREILVKQLGIGQDWQQVDLNQTITYNGQDSTISELLERRVQSKSDGDYQTSDSIRDAIAKTQYQVSDLGSGTFKVSWK